MHNNQLPKKTVEEITGYNDEENIHIQVSQTTVKCNNVNNYTT